MRDGRLLNYIDELKILMIMLIIFGFRLPEDDSLLLESTWDSESLLVKIALLFTRQYMEMVPLKQSVFI